MPYCFRMPSQRALDRLYTHPARFDVDIGAIGHQPMFSHVSRHLFLYPFMTDPFFPCTPHTSSSVHTCAAIHCEPEPEPEPWGPTLLLNHDLSLLRLAIILRAGPPTIQAYTSPELPTLSGSRTVTRCRRGVAWVNRPDTCCPVRVVPVPRSL